MIIDFLYLSANLKKIPRQGWIDKLSINNPESVADHVFSMAVMGMIFSDMENLNTEKILKIILLHDLAESIIGDISPEQISKDSKFAIENKTMKNILKNLPKTIQKQYGLLWEEYQLNNSKEAKIVHELDKLEMALQARIYSKEGHSEEMLTPFFKSSKNVIVNPKLLKLFKKICEK